MALATRRPWPAARVPLFFGVGGLAEVRRGNADEAENALGAGGEQPDGGIAEGGEDDQGAGQGDQNFLCVTDGQGLWGLLADDDVQGDDDQE